MTDKPIPIPILKLKPASVIRREARSFLAWRATKAKGAKQRRMA